MNISRDRSFAVIKEVNNRKLAIMIQLPILNKKLEELAVGFVNDTDLFSNREEAMQKIRKIMAIHTELFEVIGGEITFKKKDYYC